MEKKNINISKKWIVVICGLWIAYIALYVIDIYYLRPKRELAQQQKIKEMVKKTVDKILQEKLKMSK